MGRASRSTTCRVFADVDQVMGILLKHLALVAASGELSDRQHAHLQLACDIAASARKLFHAEAERQGVVRQMRSQ